MKETKMKRCLKFTGYIFMPDEKDSGKKLRKYLCNFGMGRVIVYDTDNKRPKDKMKAFSNIGQLVNYIGKEYTKRVAERVSKNRIR